MPPGKRPSSWSRPSIYSACVSLTFLSCAVPARTTPLRPHDSTRSSQGDTVSQSLVGSNPGQPASKAIHNPIQDYLRNTGATEVYPQVQSHPVEELIGHAEAHFQAMQEKRSYSIDEVASAYRRRRGRHPPPGFNLWYDYAVRNQAVIVEDFWDQIYEDLEPFWGTPASDIRNDARNADVVVVVRDGEAMGTSKDPLGATLMQMMNQTALYLSDMVIPVNSIQQQGLVRSWEDIQGLLSVSRTSMFQLANLENLKTSASGWNLEHDAEPPSIPETLEERDPHSQLKQACPPSSPLRQRGQTLSSQQIMDSIGRSREERSPPDPALMSYIRPGFVTDWEEATSVCNDPFMTYYCHPLMGQSSASVPANLRPLFTGSKLAEVSNDVLIPSADDWKAEAGFAHLHDRAWSKKQAKVLWRGAATKEQETNKNGSRDRRRLIELMNGTEYDLSDQPSSSSDTFTPLSHLSATSRLTQSVQESLGRWLSSLTDISNFPMSDYCEAAGKIPRRGAASESCYPSRQHTNPYQSKYLLVIDGPVASYSSNDFLQVLRSSTLPIRATFYRSWLDSRLVPWLHFVPMNNRFDNLYRLMEYFLGCPASVCDDDPIEGHDAQAEKIASAGKEWAAKVARKADMEIYVFRLLLEWARVTDDERHRLAYIDLGYVQEQRHSELKKRGSSDGLHEERRSLLEKRGSTRNSLSDKARKAALFEAALTSRESRLAGKHLTKGRLWGSTQDWLHGRWAYALEFDMYGVMKGYQRWVGMALYRRCRFSVDCMRSVLVNQKTGEPIL